MQTVCDTASHDLPGPRPRLRVDSIGIFGRFVFRAASLLFLAASVCLRAPTFIASEAPPFLYWGSRGWDSTPE